MLYIALYNAKHFPRITVPNAVEPLPEYPPVSILVPARNEASHISALIAAFRCQDYPQFEVVVLDDNSDDATQSLARNAADDDPRFQTVVGAPLPKDWVGKNWACHQLSQIAAHEWLLFTDADVTWHPQTLRAIMRHALCHQADLLTVWPTQITQTWAERLVVPMMSFVLLAYLPVALAHHPIAMGAAAANGQCLLFTRGAYQSIGGHHAIRQSLIDDVSLARRVKQAGLRLRMADGNQLLRCRMYHDAASVINGYTKSILAGHGNSVGLLVLSMVIHLSLFVAPWPIALWAAFRHAVGIALWAVGLGVLGLLVRFVTAATARQRLRDAMFFPLSILFVTLIALNAIWARIRYGGPIWKGRRVIGPQESPFGPR